jgi:uncharacterized OB-fold protein
VSSRDRSDPYWDAFWEAATDGTLRSQSCTACGHRRLPPSPQCPECLDPDAVWEPLSGLGRLWSACVYHHAYQSRLRPDLPYAVGLIALAEGPMLIARLGRRDVDAWEIDDEVQFVPNGIAETGVLTFMPRQVQN